MESYQLKEIYIDEEKARSNLRVYSWGDVHSFCDVYMEEGSLSLFNTSLKIEWIALNSNCLLRMGRFASIDLHGMGLIIFICLQLIGFIQKFFIIL
ncbi:hypothetical protein BACPU_01050 [Bacillus pumilus]|nr:hypothetical protein BACPU_01050 [Bacillus pumilus]